MTWAREEGWEEKGGRGRPRKCAAVGAYETITSVSGLLRTMAGQRARSKWPANAKTTSAPLRPSVRLSTSAGRRSQAAQRAATQTRAAFQQTSCRRSTCTVK